MWANNEVGTIQPIADIVALAAGYGIPVHSDAVQAFGSVPVDFAASGLAAMSISGHKIGGPGGRRGAAAGPRGEADPGAARRRPGTRRPLRHPGHRLHRRLRRGRRGRHRKSARRKARGSPGLRDRAHRRRPRSRARSGAARCSGGRCRHSRPGRRSGRCAGRLPGNAHFTFPGCEGDSLLFLLDMAGVESSTGSACTAGVPRPSHVLLAMGLDEDDSPRARSASAWGIHPRRRTLTHLWPRCRRRMRARNRPAWPGTTSSKRRAPRGFEPSTKQAAVEPSKPRRRPRR